MTNHLASGFSEYSARLRDFIHRHASAPAKGRAIAVETEFNQLALSLFELQVAHNEAYRKFCKARKITTAKSWHEIPAMPAVGFKEFELTSLSVDERTVAFHSSGTTEQRPSRHFHSHDSLVLYETSLRAAFPARLLTKERPQFIFLTPSAAHARHSSLVHMFETFRREFGCQTSHFIGQAERDGIWSVNLNAAVRALREAIAAKRPVMLCGTAFNFIHLLDHLEEANLLLILPAGSRVLETGGYKGRSRTLPKAELHALITDLLGVPASHIVCEYGMCELSSQAYDSLDQPNGARVLHFPAWARTRLVSPETGHEVGQSETGLIRIFDLANVYSVMAVQTEDLGIRRDDGFELIGRAAKSEPRGCSLQSN